MMLDAILRMPPDCWDGGVLDVMQRHGRYVEAADRIEALEGENARLNMEMAAYREKLTPQYWAAYKKKS